MSPFPDDENGRSLSGLTLENVRSRRKYTGPVSDTEIRERIVEAADRLYYGKGIQAVGMDELRTAADVSLKRLYTLFASKEQIVLAVLQRRHEQWTHGVADKVAQVSDPRERLLAIYDYLADWFADENFRGCGFINAFGEIGATSPAVAEQARRHKESFQAFVADLVAEAGCTDELAAQLALLAEGAQTTAAIAGNGEAAVHARRAAQVLIAAC